MSVSYKGKSPGKIWYAWHKTGAFFASFGQKSSAKKTARGMLADTGKTAASAGIGYTALQVLPWIPFATWGVGIAAVVGTGYFGVQAYRHGKELGKSTFMKSYLRGKEEAWLKKKQAPGLLARVKNVFRKKAKELPPVDTAPQQPVQRLDRTVANDFNNAQQQEEISPERQKAAEQRRAAKEKFKKNPRRF